MKCPSWIDCIIASTRAVSTTLTCLSASSTRFSTAESSLNSTLSAEEATRAWVVCSLPPAASRVLAALIEPLRLIFKNVTLTDFPEGILRKSWLCDNGTVLRRLRPEFSSGCQVRCLHGEAHKTKAPRSAEECLLIIIARDLSTCVVVVIICVDRSEIARMSFCHFTLERLVPSFSAPAVSYGPASLRPNSFFHCRVASYRAALASACVPSTQTRLGKSQRRLAH